MESFVNHSGSKVTAIPFARPSYGQCPVRAYAAFFASAVATHHLMSGREMAYPREAVRYLAVSPLCLAAHIAIMVAGDRAGFSLVAVTLASFVVVGLLGYFLHSRFTFTETYAVQGLLRYYAAMALALPLATAILWIYSRALSWPMILAAPAGSATMIVINFVAARWAVTSRNLGRAS